MNYKTDAFLITALTNMHVGSGGTNYGVVDNLVQRDPVTNMPTINASSLKGALREFFSQKWGDKDNKLKFIFGEDSSRTNSKNKESIGNYKFFSADLLVLPVRSNKKPFYRATAKMLVDNINKKANAFDLGNNFIKGNYSTDSPAIKEIANGLKLEDWQPKQDTNLSIDNNLGDDVAVFDDNNFKILTKKLPVIARNQLENGQSKNLWYEEIVPRESRFVFLVSYPEKGKDLSENYYDEFIEVLNGAVVQIGANGSIGYGYCEIKKINNDENKDK